MKELENHFIGRGEVKGIVFSQIQATEHAYLYRCINNGLTHYEVFKKRINTQYGTVSYPSAKSFGVWAWTFGNYDDALNKFNEINKLETGVK
jgi:hypothetical protein